MWYLGLGCTNNFMAFLRERPPAQKDASCPRVDGQDQDPISQSLIRQFMRKPFSTASLSPRKVSRAVWLPVKAQGKLRYTGKATGLLTWVSMVHGCPKLSPWVKGAWLGLLCLLLGQQVSGQGHPVVFWGPLPAELPRFCPWMWEHG